jgi:uncharacterized spore protein YtfJ
MSQKIVGGSDRMQELSDILKTITEEMQKTLSARTAVGDPVTVEDKTIIPLMSVGMGFGAGYKSGKEESPGGGGGGFGTKPVAVVIIDKDNVRVERLGEVRHTMVEHFAEAVPKLIEGLTHKKEPRVPIKGEGEQP